MKEKTDRRHFHTFDAFRYISFLLVFLHHLPDTNSRFISFISQSGGIGVSFFFVLSGFLISYILLNEKAKVGRINLKNFFFRRILRIWPLFYAMILFAYASPFIISKLGLSHSSEGYTPNLFVSLLFCENYKMMISGSFPDGAPLRIMWSLCVEEHFYILWSLAIAIIPTRRIPHLIVVSVLLSIATRLVYSSLDIASLDIFSNLIYFAFGAIPAYLLIYKENYFHYLDKTRDILKILIILITSVLVISTPHFSNEFLNQSSHLILGPLFAILIGLTLTQSPIRIKDSYWISKLGKYTYGLYIYHTIIILLIVQLGNTLSIEVNWGVVLVISLLLTTGVSILSYEVFEKRFLKLKKYFR